MKIAGYIILAIIILVGGYYAYEHFTQKPDEEIQRLETELDSIKAIIRADSIEQVRRDSVHDAKVLELQTTADSAKDVARVATGEARIQGERADELAERLRGLIGGHPVLDSLLAAHRAQVESYERALVAYGTTIAAQDSIIAELTVNRDDYKNANATLRDALARSEELREHWEREANPPFFIELWGDLPKLLLAGGIGMGIGYALGEG